MAPRDQFPARSAGGSAREAFAVTKDDNADLPQIPRALWVGTGGSLSVIFTPGTDPVSLTNVPNGSLLPISPSRVRSAGTSASDIVGLV